MNFRPCCGGSLKTGVKVIAGFQIATNSVALIGLSLALLLYTGIELFADSESSYGTDTISSSLSECEDLETNSTIPKAGFYRKLYLIEDHKMYIDCEYLYYQMPKFMFLILILVLYPLIIALELWKGANERNYWRCNVWFRFHSTSFIICLTMAILMYFLELKSYDTSISNSAEKSILKFALSIFFIFWLLISMYFIWVVQVFMKELRKDSLPSYLRHVEVLV